MPHFLCRWVRKEKISFVKIQWGKTKVLIVWCMTQCSKSLNITLPKSQPTQMLLIFCIKAYVIKIRQNYFLCFWVVFGLFAFCGVTFCTLSHRSTYYHHRSHRNSLSLWTFTTPCHQPALLRANQLPDWRSSLVLVGGNSGNRREAATPNCTRPCSTLNYTTLNHTMAPGKDTTGAEGGRKIQWNLLQISETTF